MFYSLTLGLYSPGGMLSSAPRMAQVIQPQVNYGTHCFGGGWSFSDRYMIQAYEAGVNFNSASSIQLRLKSR